ncbi:MAG TPA: hypothetical protein VKB31_07245 [Trueperaceae bacterium]|nr:hypothetical protein [Trueperaceae bacterium]
MKRTSVAALALIGLGLALVLSGCSKPVSPLNRTAAVQMESVGQTGDGMLYGIMDPTSTFTPAAIGSGTLATMGLSPLAISACSSTSAYQSSGWGVDSDGDGIPDHATTTYACSTSGVTLTGTLTVTDKPGQNTGYTAQIKDFKLTFTSGGQTYSMTMNISVDLSQVSSTQYTLDYSFDIVADAPGYNGHLSVTGSPQYIADSAADPFAAGTFKLNGQAEFDDSSGNYYRATRASSDLHFDKTLTCAYDFDSGSVTYADSEMNTLIVSYGCNSISATFNGGAI